MMSLRKSRRLLWSCSLIRVKQRQGPMACMLYSLPSCPRRIHTSRLKYGEEMESSNPFYEKYKEKLEKVRGPSSDLLDAVKGNKTKSPVQPFHPTAVHYPLAEPPSLDKIMIVDRILDKTSEEITELWREYHSKKDSVSATLPTEVYLQLHTKATMCPVFIYPVPRDDGYEFIYSQFNGHQFYFTTLLNYQLHSENAPVCMTLSHYTELQETKGIVLMNGDYDTKFMKPMEAQFLANQVQLYYASSDLECFNLVKQFNFQPDDFDYQLLIEQLQNRGIKVSQK